MLKKGVGMMKGYRGTRRA